MKAPFRRYAALLGIAVFCALGIGIAWPYAVNAYHLEAGGRALEEAEAFREAHPHEANPSLDRALGHFQRATELVPQDGYAHRRLGQAWLTAGNNEEAVKALRRAVELRPDHPLIHIELGYAYDGLGKVDRALAEYEQGGYGPAVEAAIANYLKAVDWKIAAGGGDEALWILQNKVLMLDPNNLPALYREMKIYESISEQAALEFAEPLREQLRQFPIENITMPSEARLAGYIAQTMIALVDEGIWNREMLHTRVYKQIGDIH